MEIPFKGQYDRDIFFRAVKLANRPPRNQARFLGLVALFAIGAVGLMVYRIVTSGDFAGNALWLVAAILMTAALGWIYLQPYLLARKMWANPGTRRPLRGTITNRGIVYDLPEGRNEIPWNRFRRLRRSKSLVTLIRDDGLLVVFPQSFFKKSADWRKFLKLLETVST
jgi:hypothetical protein